jgi:hypothetical protein
MGRLSYNGKLIAIVCKQDKHLHKKFYELKKRANIYMQKRLTNEEFLQFLLDVFERKLMEDEMRRRLISY